MIIRGNGSIHGGMSEELKELSAFVLYMQRRPHGIAKREGEREGEGEREREGGRRREGEREGEGERERERAVANRSELCVEISEN